jgi:hypothetical protein
MVPNFLFSVGDQEMDTIQQVLPHRLILRVGMVVFFMKQSVADFVPVQLQFEI